MGFWVWGLRFGVCGGPVVRVQSSGFRSSGFKCPGVHWFDVQETLVSSGYSVLGV